MKIGTKYIVEMRARSTMADGSSHTGEWSPIPEPGSKTLVEAMARLAEWRRDAVDPASDVADEISKISGALTGSKTILQARIEKVTVDAETAYGIEDIDLFSRFNDPTVPAYIIEYRMVAGPKSMMKTAAWEAMPVKPFKDVYDAIREMERFSSRSKNPKGSLPPVVADALDALQKLMVGCDTSIEMRVIKRLQGVADEVVEEAMAAW